MYKIVPWDDMENIKEFDIYIDALQYGDRYYGSRYDLIEVYDFCGKTERRNDETD